MSSRISFVGLIVFLLLGRPGAVRAQFEELLPKTPHMANAIFLVNVEKILGSPAAAAGNWKTKAHEAYASGVTILPPDATQAVLAAHFELESMTAVWEATAMKLKGEPSLERLAAATGGHLGKIGELNFVATPGNAFIVQFAPHVVGAMAPTNRQMVARWIREVKAQPAGNLSAYLQEASAFATNLGTPVVLALDLEDAVSHEQIHRAVRESETLTKAKVDVEKASQFLAGIRGVTLGVTFRNVVPFGAVRVDFRDDISVSPELAKQLLLEALANHGAMLNELYEWKPSIEGKTFRLEGHFDQGGLRRVFSLFDRPPSLPKKADAEVASVPQKPADPEVAATQAYLRHVSDMLEDLRKKPREYPNYSVGQTGVWYDTYSRKIDRLPTMYVDEEAAKFGAKAANNLRSASQTIRQGAAQGRIGVTSLPANYNYFTQNEIYGYAYRWNWFGGAVVPQGTSTTYAVPDTAADIAARTRVRTETRVNSMNQAKAYIDEVYSELASIRKSMTQKYNAEF